MTKKTTDNFIYRPSSKIGKEHITIYGCGKFQEEQLQLNKVEAALLVTELLTFLNKK
jgi:hypothetical protein